MRIAIYSDTFYPELNGVANVAYQSAQALTEAGHEVIVAIAPGDGNKDFLIKNEKFEVVFYPSFSIGKIYPGQRMATPLSIAAFLKIKKFNPQIIHSHTPFIMGWESVMTAKVLGAKLIGTHHTFFDHYLKHVRMEYDWLKWFSWKYTVRYYNFCDLVLSPTKTLASELEGQGLRQPIKVLPNPIDVNFFKPSELNKKESLKKKFGIPALAIMYMGRISYEKSIDQVVRSFALVLEKVPDTKLMIVGDGPEKSNLQDLAKELNISQNIIFTGTLRGPDLLEALNAVDVFVTASKSENMPLSILEAMASGLPIVGVKEKGIPEIVKDGQNGHVAEKDNPADIAEKIISILEHSDLRERMSEKSRTMALDHSSQSILAKLEKIYQDVLNSPQQ